MGEVVSLMIERVAAAIDPEAWDRTHEARWELDKLTKMLLWSSPDDAKRLILGAYGEDGECGRDGAAGSRFIADANENETTAIWHAMIDAALEVPAPSGIDGLIQPEKGSGETT